jgi:hypothetical protein
MLDERGPAGSSGTGTTVGRPGGLPQTPPLDLTRLASLLADATTRARLVAGGALGPLNERQRAASLELLRCLVHLDGLVARSAVPHRVEARPFDLGRLTVEVAGTLRFLAHRRQVTLSCVGVGSGHVGRSDPVVVGHHLTEALRAAIAASPVGGRVLVELARTSGRLTLDLSSPGWEPALPAAAPAGSGLASSVLRTAAGSRLVLSMEAVDAG